MLLARIAIAGAGLERFATEIRNLQRTEVREVEEPFGAGQKGSSAMPHKRNPILAERICGLARVLRGYAQAGIENIALWHERDISHSGAERVDPPRRDDRPRLHAAPRRPLAEGMTVHTERMRENLELTHGALFSQRALTALVEAGMTRDEAYRLVQESAQRAWDEGIDFRELIGQGGPELDLDAVFDYDAYLEHVPEVIARLDGTALSGLGADDPLHLRAGERHGPRSATPADGRRRRSTRPATSTSCARYAVTDSSPGPGASRDEDRAEVRR